MGLGLLLGRNGSRLATRSSSGAGIYLEGREVQESFALGSYTTVFQAEVYAILAVAGRAEVRNGAEQIIYICSDSQAALKAVCSPRTRSALVQECGDALEELARHKQVRLVWVPGHMGVPGNEKADELARLGAEETCHGPEPMLETSYHFLGQCEAFGRLRHCIFGSEALLREEMSSLAMSDILTFIRRSERFDEGAREAHG
ncbi:hypothetical protein NQ314_002029 [Rhamnusium bicolor]|uniref:RNase H type-1 domain-containing protein n=1 Tax=Rhamnusium bicolor TaxID=1586634 RepID=A0AAV8ZSN1_9CUCU|nr:hypothetical protein NQ314_002029 [Rhamnusium bicolor]